ncbi:hypothetical protein ABIC37_005376 [Priestia megaterium]|uniref:hypothetical protein n=1 Tax=Priestia megaterium TaxID=1404 RepID=UPI0033965F2E
MRAKIKKANHVFMFEASREYAPKEIDPSMLQRGFFSCPSCKTTVYYAKNHFFSADHDKDCEYVENEDK